MSEIQGMKVQPGVPQQHATRAVFFIGGFGAASWAPLVPLLKPEGRLLMLVKPQFELQPGQVGKGGIVRDASLYAEVEQRIRACCADIGLQVIGWHDSPIAGGDGNREFFVDARRAV